MHIAFIGVGQVGSALASHLRNAGHDVIIAARDVRSESVTALQTRHPSIQAVAPAEAAAPGARVVKAFTVYGFENFIDPAYPAYGDLRPVMPIAGDDADAKRTVSELCEEIGWQAVDTGPLANSLHLEHMTLLWIKMARVQGRGANFVYGLLER